MTAAPRPLRLEGQRGLEHGSAVRPQRLGELVRGGLAHDHHEGRRSRLHQVLDALPEVVFDAEAPGGAQRRPHDPAGHPGQRRQREHEQQPDQRPPEQAADRTLGHRVVRGRGDVHLAVLIAPDDGRVLQVHQVVVPQLDELGPDVVGPVLVRVTDDDQVTHRGTLSADRPTPSASPRRARRISSDLVVRGRPRDYQVGGCVRRRGREAWAVSTRRDQRTVDFRNTVIIMTSNIGSEYLVGDAASDGEIKPDASRLWRTTTRLANRSGDVGGLPTWRTWLPWW